MPTNLAINDAAMAVHKDKPTRKPVEPTAISTRGSSEFGHKFRQAARNPRDPHGRKRDEKKAGEIGAVSGMAALPATMSQPGAAGAVESAVEAKRLESKFKVHTQVGPALGKTQTGETQAMKVRGVQALKATSQPNLEREKNAASGQKAKHAKPPIHLRGAQVGINSVATQTSAVVTAPQHSGPVSVLETKDTDDPLRPEALGSQKVEGDQALIALRSTGHSPLAAHSSARAGENVALVRSVSAQLAGAADQDGTVSEVTLDPVELGKVRMTLHTTEHGITIHFNAERPETLDLLRKNTDALMSDFQSLGHSDVEFSFTGGQQDTAPDGLDGDSGPVVADDRPQVGMANQVSVHIVAMDSSGALDLRL